MEPITGKEKTKKNILTLWVIWAAMIGSLAMYVILCHLMGDEIGRNTNPDIPVDRMRKILFLVAAVTLFIAYYLRTFMLSGRIKSLGITLTGSGIFTSKQPPHITKYTTAMIISLALSESIGIYGLLLFFLGDSFNTLYTFIGVSAIAMYFFRPKGYEIEMLANTTTTKGDTSQDYPNQ
jgi:F0F1-type ATP synthase membrane subunit c/vacuolar-type H+-ATPase subunit K